MCDGFSAKLTAEPTHRVATDFFGGGVRVGEPRDLQWDDPAGTRSRPHFVMPVVPGADTRQAELRIVGTCEHGAGEPGHHRREAERCGDAPEVHVAHARVDVVRARPHVVEARRLERPLVTRSTDDRVEAHVGDELRFEAPHLTAGLVLDDPGRAVGERVREPPLEHVRWFHEVVVDRDDEEARLARFRVREQRAHPGRWSRWWQRLSNVTVPDIGGNLLTPTTRRFSPGGVPRTRPRLGCRRRVSARRARAHGSRWSQVDPRGP